MCLTLDTPQKLAKDWEIQEWGKMLADECEGLGIKVRVTKELRTLYLIV